MLPTGWTVVAILLVAVSAPGCGKSPPKDLPDASVLDAASFDATSQVDAHDAGPAALSVLFIGDSYTYVNDLPGMLSQIAATAGVPPAITTAQVVQGGATLEVQWNNGVAKAQITEHRWTHVVLQGQSEEPLFDNGTFVTYARKFESVIVDTGARPTLFVTWARAAGDAIYVPTSDGYIALPAMMQDELTAAYDGLAEQEPGDLLVCVGQAFQLAIRQYPEIALQQSDFSHPTVAGTYLAASTFYVALTGRPVPSESAVPAGVSSEDARHLREIARVGSNCAHVTVKGAVALWGNAVETSLFEDAIPDGGIFDAGSSEAGSLDYGTAGTPITNYIGVTNLGPTPVGVVDGMTLAPPFVWANGAGYPGGSGTFTFEGVGEEFCTSSLPPVVDDVGSYCVLAVTYTGATSGSGVLTLKLSDAYESSVSLSLLGSSTKRALLTVSDDVGSFGCSDSTCGPSSLSCGTPRSLLVSNRGGAPTTSLGVGVPLSPPFSWGPGGDAGAFPGGTGTGSMYGQSYDYCQTPALEAGQSCVLTVGCVDVGSTPYYGAVNLAYSDAIGSVSPNANRNLRGGPPLPP